MSSIIVLFFGLNFTWANIPSGLADLNIPQEIANRSKEIIMINRIITGKRELKDSINDDRRAVVHKNVAEDRTAA